jgi:hypothetical protein
MFVSNLKAKHDGISERELGECPYLEKEKCLKFSEGLNSSKII